MSPSTDSREMHGFAYEIKFLVSPEAADRIREWARARLLPDPHATAETGDGYLTDSLYFDTGRFDVYHRNGSYGRSKYRVRRYCHSDAAFLERKLRTRNRVVKRRTTVEVAEVAAVCYGEPERRATGAWFGRRLMARALRPVCQITYLRTARVAMTGYGPIRLTLDRDIRALPVERAGFREGDGVLLLEEHHVLELKYRHAMPAVFKQLVEEYRLAPRPVSKYRLAAPALGLVAPLRPPVHELLEPVYA